MSEAQRLMTCPACGGTGVMLSKTVGAVLTIDHGSISLSCKPETIQLFVNRMVAAKVQRELQAAIDAAMKEKL